LALGTVFQLEVNIELIDVCTLMAIYSH
jgi:hypothetical protein